VGFILRKANIEGKGTYSCLDIDPKLNDKGV
jgi:hypothetical protein